MITNVINCAINEKKYNANVAVVAKEKTTENGKQTTFVEFANLKDRTTAAVFKCIVAGLLSDETTTTELKAQFSALKGEDGKQTAFELDETALAKAFKASRDLKGKPLFLPPTFRRLIANFSEDYSIGYADNEGVFHRLVSVVGKLSLKSLLMVDSKKVLEFAAANSATKRALIHTMANAAVANMNKEAAYNKLYTAATVANTTETKPETKKGKGGKKATETKPETETAKA